MVPPCSNLVRVPTCKWPFRIPSSKELEVAYTQTAGKTLLTLSFFVALLNSSTYLSAPLRTVKFTIICG